MTAGLALALLLAAPPAPLNASAVEAEGDAAVAALRVPPPADPASAGTVAACEQALATEQERGRRHEAWDAALAALSVGDVDARIAQAEARGRLAHALAEHWWAAPDPFVGPGPDCAFGDCPRALPPDCPKPPGVGAGPPPADVEERGLLALIGTNGDRPCLSLCIESTGCGPIQEPSAAVEARAVVHYVAAVTLARAEHRFTPPVARALAALSRIDPDRYPVPKPEIVAVWLDGAASTELLFPLAWARPRAVE